MRAIKKLESSEGGFTLVELITAIVIGALFFGAVSNLISNNSHLAQRARDVAAANSFVENKVEELRSAGYLSLSNGTTNITSELPSELKTPRSGSLVISSASTSIKRVVITVTYNDQGKSKTYSYTTYVGELGVGQN